MGVWGSGSFDSDDAGDWVSDLEEADDLSILEASFAKILETEDDLEAEDDLDAGDCREALAAAEIVAALRGKPAKELPEEVSDFLQRVPGPPPAELVAAALAVIERIKTKSELKELWDESERAAEWADAVGELEGRLG